MIKRNNDFNYITPSCSTEWLGDNNKAYGGACLVKCAYCGWFYDYRVSEKHNCKGKIEAMQILLKVNK